MRAMGTAAGVPIEPPEQTALLNACASVAGVIGGGVPGGARPVPCSATRATADRQRRTAGGYDATWVLVFDPADLAAEQLPSSRVEALWRAWPALRVSPLSAGESVAKGVRVEELGAVRGLAGLVQP